MPGTYLAPGSDPRAGRWAIQPDPRLERRYAPRPCRPAGGLVLRF